MLIITSQSVDLNVFLLMNLLGLRYFFIFKSFCYHFSTKKNWIYALLLLFIYVVALIRAHFVQGFSVNFLYNDQTHSINALARFSIYFINNWLQLFSLSQLAYFSNWMIYIFRTPSRTWNIFNFLRNKISLQSTANFFNWELRVSTLQYELNCNLLTNDMNE